MSAPERGVAVWRKTSTFEDGVSVMFADNYVRHGENCEVEPGRWFPEAEAAALVAAERVVEAALLFVERWHADHTHDPLGLVTALGDYDDARAAS